MTPGDDGGIGCRLISQARFVRARVTAPIGPARCAAFEEWADLDRLAGVEVVLAAPSTAMLGSLFGHLFLRLVYRDGERDAGDGDATPAHLSRTVAFLADNDVPFTEDPTYAVKGIVGSYAASLHERAFLDVYREYVVVEGRDLRRWRLNLTDGRAARAAGTHLDRPARDQGRLLLLPAELRDVDGRPGRRHPRAGGGRRRARVAGGAARHDAGAVG